jgi:glycosyltransferase involved in cell wall biosynthesis
MEQTMRELVRDGRPQVAHLDDLGVAQLGPVPGSINVYSAHNIEHRILDSTATISSGLRRQFARIERRKVSAIEHRVWQTMTLSLACSDVDAVQMERGGARVIVCPNGADPAQPLPVPTRRPDEPFRLVFVGALNYRPNRLGLEWFIAEVLPKLRRSLAVPVVVDAVGTPPRGLLASDGVVMHGRVPSVQPYYERAHAVIVPVLFGSGTRLKMVEAMALRRPIVATAIGAEGLPAVAGVDYYEADEPAAFASALAKIAHRCENADPLLERMLASARAAVEPLLWPRIVANLAETYLAEIAAARN